MAALIAVFGIILLEHYNRRMTRARGAGGKYHDYLARHAIDVRKISGVPRVEKGPDYDLEELVIFRVVILGSVFPALLVNAVK